MKELLFFYMNGCPHCKKADKLISELKDENPKYNDITITKIEENEQAELANKYDYYYVPSFYIDKKKLHEGTVSKADVEAVLDAALK